MRSVDEPNIPAAQFRTMGRTQIALPAISASVGKLTYFPSYVKERQGILSEMRRWNDACGKPAAVPLTSAQSIHC
jgi:hypothetical protein